MPEPFDVILGRWGRFTRYELRDGYIRPAPDAIFEWYDPWEVYRKSWDKEALDSDRENYIAISDLRKRGQSYHSLLHLLKKLRFIPTPHGRIAFFNPESQHGHRYELAPESEPTLLKWCTKYGLLGILPQQTYAAFLAPRWEGEWGNTLWPNQRIYLRTNTGWSASIKQQIGVGSPVLTDQPERKGEIITEESVSEQYSHSGVLIQDLKSFDIRYESLSQTWGAFFPHIPIEERETYQYPVPLSEDFWQLYAESIADFLQGAQTLFEALTYLTSRESLDDTSENDLRRGRDILHALVAPVGLALYPTDQGVLRQQWVAPSLLASFAAMALLDLAEKRLLRCLHCNALFPSDAYRAAYCSDRCRHTARKRRYRERNTEKAKAQQKKDYEARIARRKEKGNGKARTK